MIFNRHNKKCGKKCRHACGCVGSEDNQSDTPFRHRRGHLLEGSMTLDLLKPGDRARIIAVGGRGALRRHLLDMGLTPNTMVMVRKLAPLGDPIELHLRNFELTLRKEDAKHIMVEAVNQ